MATRRPCRVLLVDDERTYVDSLAKVLSRRGMEVRVAYGGAGALEVLSRESFDAVILDLHMPGMDGRATLAALRRRDALTPVLVLTGKAEVPLAAEALRGGATDVLTKPCPVEELWAAVEDARERKAAAVAAALPAESPGDRP